MSHRNVEFGLKLFNDGIESNSWDHFRKEKSTA